jgi:hypothetical protein
MSIAIRSIMSNVSPNISYFSQRIIEIGEVYTPLIMICQLFCQGFRLHTPKAYKIICRHPVSRDLRADLAAKVLSEDARIYLYLVVFRLRSTIELSEVAFPWLIWSFRRSSRNIASQLRRLNVGDIFSQWFKRRIGLCHRRLLPRRIIQIQRIHWYIGCPTLDVGEPGPSNRFDYDVLIKFSSSYKFAIHVNTSLQSFHPLEKTWTKVSPGMTIKMT